jgi:ProP effector
MRKNELHPRTKILNQQQKNKSRQARQSALTWLTQRFPKAFDTKTSIHALQIGVMHEVLKYADEASSFGISKAKLRQALVAFTRRLDYLACLKAQGGRINLQGEFVGQVSEAEALNAAQKIKKWIEKSVKSSKKNQEELTTSQHAGFSEFAVVKDIVTSQKTEVIFKTRTTKNFDPEAVSRLKSKLGLTKKMNEFETS